MTEVRLTFRAGGCGCRGHHDPRCVYHPDFVQARTPGNNHVGPSPIRADFPHTDAGTRAYGNAWQTWLKQLADCRMTRAERNVRDRTLAELFGVSLKVARAMPNVATLRRFERMNPDDRALVIAAIESL